MKLCQVCCLQVPLNHYKCPNGHVLAEQVKEPRAELFGTTLELAPLGSSGWVCEFFGGRAWQPVKVSAPRDPEWIELVGMGQVFRLTPRALLDIGGNVDGIFFEIHPGSSFLVRMPEFKTTELWPSVTVVGRYTGGPL